MKSPKTKTPTLRCNQTQLAAMLGCSRTTIWKLLQRPDAPKPKNGKFVVEEMRKFVAANAPSASEPNELWQLRIRKMKVEVEQAEREAAIRRGESIAAEELKTTIPPLAREFTDTLQQKFVSELPGKYRGRSQAEIAEMNRDAIHACILRFKTGALAIEDKNSS